MGKSDKETVQEMMIWVEANDTDATCELASFYYNGERGLLQDQTKAIELWTQAATLGSMDVQYYLDGIYDKRGDLKKAKFHSRLYHVCQIWIMQLQMRSCNV